MSFEHPWPDLAPWEELQRLLILLDANLDGVESDPDCVAALAGADPGAAADLLCAVMEAAPKLYHLQQWLTKHPEIVAMAARMAGGRSSSL